MTGMGVGEGEKISGGTSHVRPRKYETYTVMRDHRWKINMQFLGLAH